MSHFEVSWIARWFFLFMSAFQHIWVLYESISHLCLSSFMFNTLCCAWFWNRSLVTYSSQRKWEINRIVLWKFFKHKMEHRKNQKSSVKFRITHRPICVCITVVYSCRRRHRHHQIHYLRCSNNATAYCWRRCGHRWQLTKCDTSGWWMYKKCASYKLCFCVQTVLWWRAPTTTPFLSISLFRPATLAGLLSLPLCDLVHIIWQICV